MSSHYKTKEPIPTKVLAKLVASSPPAKPSSPTSGLEPPQSLLPHWCRRSRRGWSWRQSRASRDRTRGRMSLLDYGRGGRACLGLAWGSCKPSQPLPWISDPQGLSCPVESATWLRGHTCPPLGRGPGRSSQWSPWWRCHPPCIAQHLGARLGYPPPWRRSDPEVSGKCPSAL